MFRHKKVLAFVNRAVYLLSAAMLMAGAVLTVTPQPVTAGSGAIWTTTSNCGAPQDANQYAHGATVYIHGENFDPSTSYPWTITGQPGGASGDPGATVASGTESSDVNGAFCFAAYIINNDDWGTYTVDVVGANKNDNYRVEGEPLTFSLNITKDILPSSVYTIGGDINYLIVVTNTGTGPLTGVTVDDSGGTGLSCTWPGTSGELPAGSSVSCTTYHRVVQADYDSGSFSNTATTDSNETGQDSDSEIAYFAQSPSLALEKSALPVTYSVSQGISYSYELTNDGNVTLTSPFTVSDDKLTVTCPGTASLAPGASITCTASYTTSQGDVDAGSITNVATGYGKFGSSTVTSNQDTVTITAISSTSISLDKTPTPTTYSVVGAVINYSYRVTNTGTKTILGGASVTDDKLSVTCPVITSLAPGAYVDCTASHTITQADLDAGSITNHATAYVGSVTSNQDEATVTAVPNRTISLSKDATPSTYSVVGAVISYSYVITNTGNVTLASPASISDDKATVTCPAGSLAPLATLTCTASYTITQADLDAGFVTNHATASMGGATSNQAEETVDAVQNPSLGIVKTALPLTYSLVGDSITYSYVITNTGNVTLDGPFSVVDDKATVTCTQPADGKLSPAETMSCSATYTIIQADLDSGSVKNIAYATNGEVTSPNDDETVTAVQTPELELTKTVDPLSFSAIGNVLSYSYELKNTGNVTLSGPFTVSDDKATVTCPATASLAPGASITCTASYTIKLADLIAELVTNTATAHGFFKTAPIDSNEDDATAFANAAPALSIDKTTSTADFDAVGDTISYSYLLTNTGNVVLSAPFTVTDDKTTATCPATPTTLNPGDTITCTATYTITQADLDAGSVINVAYGTGNYKSTPVDSVTDTVTVLAVVNPALSIDKTVLETQFNLVGEVLHYSYLVTNIGNVTLDGPFTITDDKATDEACPVTLTLAPLASITCTATYTITLADQTTGFVTNIASAHGWFGKGEAKEAVDSLTDTVTVNAEPLEAISILDPYCFSIPGTLMQWVVNNPNTDPFSVTFWEIDGVGQQTGFIAPAGMSLLTTTALGTHTIDLYWGASGHTSLQFTINSCTPPPDETPTPGPTPTTPPTNRVTPQVVPTLPIPITGQGGEIIPVTGADRTPFGNIWVFAGFGMFGFGMVLSGLRKRLGL